MCEEEVQLQHRQCLPGTMKLKMGEYKLTYQMVSLPHAFTVVRTGKSRGALPTHGTHPWNTRQVWQAPHFDEL